VPLKIWVQPPYSAKTRRRRCCRTGARQCAKIAIQFHRALPKRLKGNHNRLPSLPCSRGVADLCPTQGDTQHLESRFQESARSSQPSGLFVFDFPRDGFHSPLRLRSLLFVPTTGNGKRTRAFNPRAAQRPYARRSYRTARESWVRRSSHRATARRAICEPTSISRRTP
jgi:hypothetical protein